VQFDDGGFTTGVGLLLLGKALSGQLAKIFLVGV